MDLSLVSAAYPPDLDGIGDYTWWMANTLVKQHTVRIFTRNGTLGLSSSCMEVIPFFNLTSASSFASLTPLIKNIYVGKNSETSWLLLQYNPFSWGNRGFCPWIPKTLREIKRSAFRPRVAVMFHETYTKETGFRPGAMRIWQRTFCRAIANAADVCFVSVRDFLGDLNLKNRSSGKLLPVGSNLPEVDIDSCTAKKRIGLKPDDLVIGGFGQFHPSRDVQLMMNAFHEIKKRIPNAHFLYVGSGGNEMRRLFGDSGLLMTGNVSSLDAARSIQAIDLFLSPFRDGISTRRGSIAAALQQGLPIVSTAGKLTDEALHCENGSSFELVPVGNDADFIIKCLELCRNDERRRLLGRHARTLFEKVFSWPVICEHLSSTLNSNANSRSGYTHSVTVKGQ